jgi:hypothetical protein
MACGFPPLRSLLTILFSAKFLSAAVTHNAASFSVKNTSTKGICHRRYNGRSQWDGEGRAILSSEPWSLERFQALLAR